MTTDQLWALKIILDLAKEYMRHSSAASLRIHKRQNAAVIILELLIAENEEKDNGNTR